MRDLAGEVLTATEDPREPMVSYLRVDLKEAVTEEAVRHAVQQLSDANPKLKMGFELEHNRLEWKAQSSAEIFVPQTTSLETFLNQVIPTFPGPAWRVKLEGDKSIYIAVHHGICDGTALTRIASVLVERLLAPGSATLELTNLEKRGKPLPEGLRAMFVVYREVVKKMALARFRPPILLGDLQPSTSHRQHQLYAHWSEAKFKQLREALVNARIERNLTNVLLMALHKTIGDFDGKHLAGDDRVAVMLPIDLRGYLEAPEPLWNCVGTMIINSRAHERESTEHLGGVIRHQTSRIDQEKEFSSSFALLRHFCEDMDLGGQKVVISESGEAKPVNWRLESSACLSFLPQIPLSAGSRPRIEAIYGAPPAKTPMGVSIGIGVIHQTMTFCLRFSDSAFSESQARDFFTRFQDHVWSLALYERFA